MEGGARDGRSLEVMSDEATTIGGGADGSDRRMADDRTRMMRSYLRKTSRIEWRQLAVVFDRIVFIFFFVILAGLTLSFSQYI